jgi:hypothetical protein
VATVTGFVPSVNGFAFDNAFPNEPAVTIDLGVARIPFGNAANGLCGGMVFAALDYWYQGTRPPQEPTPPRPGTPYFRYLLRRLIDSWHLPTGALTYLALMNPAYPDRDRRIGPLTVRGRGGRMLTREWPAVRAALDAGRPCPLGLVTVRSANPLLVGNNHQLLAYGYEQDDSVVRIAAYDPNQAGRDDLVVTLERSEPAHLSFGPAGSSSGQDVVCFFAVDYAPETPPIESVGQAANRDEQPPAEGR